MAFLSVAQAVLFAVDGLLTYADFHQKCTNHVDLADRTLQTAFAFDCEWGILLIVLWTIGLILSVIMFLSLAGVACCNVSAFDRYQRLRAHRGVLLPAESERTNRVTRIGTVVGIVLVVVLFVVMMVSPLSIRF